MCCQLGFSKSANPSVYGLQQFPIIIYKLLTKQSNKFDLRGGVWSGASFLQMGKVVSYPINNNWQSSNTYKQHSSTEHELKYPLSPFLAFVHHNPAFQQGIFNGKDNNQLRFTQFTFHKNYQLFRQWPQLLTSSSHNRSCLHLTETIFLRLPLLISAAKAEPLQCHKKEGNKQVFPWSFVNC